MKDNHQPLAVIGMACWLPGAEGLDQFWHLLIENRSAIQNVPENLLDRQLYFSTKKGERGKSYIDQGGLISYPAFNQSICRYPAHVMNYVEVGHLLMAETAAKACIHAGLNPFDIPFRNTGVYVGNNQAGHLAGNLTYATMVGEAAKYLKELSVYREVTGERAEQIINEVVSEIRHKLPNYGHNGFPTVGYHVTANAVSDALGLSGPSIVLDAACSSSLKALALAAHDIQLGQIDMAIVGGSSFFTTDSLLLFSAAQSGSANGCFPFSDKADGLISAEGNVAIVVKSLDRALADGDPIQAIIPGIGVSSDGRGKSLWAPRKEGQVKAIQRAYMSEADMQWLDYVEAHATSTAVGDQTELEAMQQAFQHFHRQAKIPIGGVKANIGHALEAAGLAGLLKTILILQKGIVPKQINSTPLNSKVDWDALPFFVPQENTPLPPRQDGRARRAAVNSFGIGGLNVHVLLQEFRREDMPTLVSPQPSTPKQQLPEPIAVVGVGAIFPGARTAAAFEQLLFSGQDATCEVPDRWDWETGYSKDASGHWQSRGKRGGFITDFQYDWQRHRIAPKQLANADPLQFMILDSVDAAIADAGYDPKQMPKETTGVIVGSTFDTDFSLQLGMGFRLPHFQRELRKILERHGIVDAPRVEQILEQYAELLVKRMPAILDETGSFTPSTLSSRITKTYDFMGGAGTIDSGYTVGLSALMQAVNALRCGQCDVMVCSTGARMMGLSMFLRMSLAGHLTEDRTRNPFDKTFTGQVPGEGAGTLILKRLSDAQRDGDQIHCIVHGVGCGYDANPEMAFEQSMVRAWERTNLSKNDVLLIETSSGAEVVAQELKAIERVYGTADYSTPVLMDRVDAQFGNMLGASGMASLLKANCELQQFRMPGSFALSVPDESVVGSGKRLAVTTSPQRFQKKKTLDGTTPRYLAGVSSWDPCGSAYHAIIERGNRVPLDDDDVQNHDVQSNADRIETQPVANTASPWVIIRLAGNNAAELQNAVEQALGNPIACYETAKSQLGNAFPPCDFRLAVVASSTEDLAKKLGLAQQYPEAEKLDFLTKNGVFYGTPETPPGKVAFFCPGQGSQYASMLKPLVGHFAPAKAALDDINRDLRELGYPTFDQLAWSDDNELGRDVFKTQLSLLCADTILLRSLAALGVTPDVVAGHSFGEFAALVASGAWSFREGAKATFLRCRAIVECRSALGVMLSTNWDAAASQRVCDELSDGLFVANINAPDQTVLGGSEQAVAAAEQLIKSQKGLAKIIPVPRPFHTPLMQDVCKPLYDALGDVDTQNPQIPFFSSVSNRYESDPERIRRNLADQMTQPVRYIDLVRQLHDDGATILVECGPNQVLTSLHRKILAEKKAILLSADSKQGDGVFPLLCIRAAIEVCHASEKCSGNEIQAGMDRSAMTGWAEVHHDQLIPLLRRLADQGGIAAENQGKLPECDAFAAATIADAIQVFEPAVKALMVSFGGLSELIAAVDKMTMQEVDCPTATRQVMPSPELPKQSFPELQALSPPLISEAEFRRLSRDDNGKPPTGLPDGDVYPRYTMRMMSKPLGTAGQKAVKWQGRALVVGQNEVGRALIEQIRERGGDPVLLPLSGDRETMLQEIERLWQEKPILHLFLVTAHDPDAVTELSEGDWNRRRDRGIFLPFFVCWKWYQWIAKNTLLSKATLCTSSCLGGDFGFSGKMRSVEGGATAGLVKSLDLEAGMPTNFAFLSKQIDFSGTESAAERAHCILSELSAAIPYETEIAYIGEQRYVTRPIVQRATMNHSPNELPSGNWVVTGGGRGITAFLAEHLAEQYPAVRLHLLGSRPAPQIDPTWYALEGDTERQTWRKRFHQNAEAAGENALDKWRQFEYALELDATMNAMRRKGINVSYYHCDVTDRNRLAQTLQTIREQHGPISGIMHGAGIEVSCRMEVKDPKIVEKTFRIKVDAAAALMDLTRNDPVRHFIGFGSVSGRMGSIGQADYSMTNETLAKLCDWYQRQRPDCRVTCFHWGPWDQIGMAARPEMQANPILAAMTLLPPQEGLRHFLNELVADERTTETLLIGWSHYKLYYPDSEPAATDTQEDAGNVALQTPVTATTKSPEPLELNQTPICRLVVRMVDGATVPVREKPVFAGTTMIVGKNPDADILVKTLQGAGVRVAQVPALENKDALLAELERVWTTNGPVSHLFLMTGRDTEALDVSDTKHWQKRRQAGLFALLYLLRDWLRKIDEAKMMDQCAVVAATNMNGDFGITSGTSALECAGIAGLLKTIHLEHGGPERNGMTVRIVDFAASATGEEVVSHLLAELTTGGFDIEAAYVNGRRRVPRLFRQDAITNGPGVKRGSTWVITGGARGITAEVALALGKHYGLKLHLIGSSPLTQIDDMMRSLTEEQLKPYKREIVKKALAAKESPDKEWNRFRNALEMDRNLVRMKNAGIDVHYHQCDITDPKQVASVFAEIRRLSGDINGIIHGAGIDGNPATIKNMPEPQFDVADKLIAIKTDAVLEMLRHVNLPALEYFVGFGSISGRFGSANVLAYCSGNDMLCKIMGQLRNEAPHCRTVGIHWHAWGEVGMMMRPASYGSIKVLKMQMMPPDTGVAHLIRELDAGLPENEIIITDSQYYTLFYSPEMLAENSTATFSVSPNPAARLLPGKERLISGNITTPLVESLEMFPCEEPTARAKIRFLPDRDPFLTDHCFRGRPFLPAVIALEAFAETAKRMFPAKSVVALHDLELIKGIVFLANEPLEVTIMAEATGNLVACRLMAALKNKDGKILDAEHVFAKAVVELADTEQHPHLSMPQPPVGEWHKIWYSDKSAMMYHGPKFQQTSAGLFDETLGVWSKVEAFPIADFAGSRSSTGWQFHPATVDACLYLCGACVWLELKGALGLPKSLQRLKLGRMPKPSEACMSHITIKSKLDSEFVFDVLCCGEDGETLFCIENYHCQVVPTSLGSKTGKTK